MINVQGLFWKIYYLICNVFTGEVNLTDYIGDLTDIQHFFLEVVSFMYLIAIFLLPVMVVVSIFKYLLRRFE